MGFEVVNALPGRAEDVQHAYIGTRLQNMPDEFLLRNIDNQDVWVSEAENLEIREETHVRIRIANIQLQPEKLVRCHCTLLTLTISHAPSCCCYCCAQPGPATGWGD